jgi:hypothetical protein
MSSRQQEKERRRQERLERERQEAAAAARKRRLGLVAGGAIAAALVIAVVVAVAAGGGGGGSKSSKQTGIKDVPVPGRKITSLDAAAKAAGCTLKTFVPGSHDRDHVTTSVKYKQNPPVFGPHNPVPASDGIYDPGKTPSIETLVHPLEHGRVEFQYKPGTSTKQIGQLQSVAKEAKGYHVLLFENPTGMPFAVAATAWTHQLGCPTFNPKVFDALRDFRLAYLDKGPEFIPGPE